MNLTAAQDFVSFLTSEAFQSQLKTYLPTTDPGGPPFVADASPNLKVSSGLPKNYHAGKPVTVKGTLVNAEPGYPALSGETVNVDQIVGSVPLPSPAADELDRRLQHPVHTDLHRVLPGVDRSDLEDRERDVEPALR